MPRGMWDLPGPGIKPVSPALAGGFFTTEPPGTLLPFWGGGAVGMLYVISQGSGRESVS